MIDHLLENLAVALIVGASAWYAGKRYLPARWRARMNGASVPAGSCDTGCSSCKGCPDESEPAVQAWAQVVRLHRK
jgi:hypothetical protein